MGRYGKLMCTHLVLFLATGKKGRSGRQVTTEQQSRKAKQNQRCRGGAPSHGHALRRRRPWYANRAPIRVFGVGGGGNKCAKLGWCRVQKTEETREREKEEQRRRRKIVHRFLPQKKLGPPSDSLTPKLLQPLLRSTH